MTNYKRTKMEDKDKRAQVWSLDIVIACLIFLVGIVILFFYAINYTNQSEIQLDDLFYQGNTAAELILSNEEPGILSESKINQTKLDEFYNADYETIKNKLNIKDDFYFVVDGLEVSGVSIDYVGQMPGTGIKNKIKIERFSVYKNKPVKFQLYIWR